MEYVLINKYCKTLLNYFVYPNSCFSVQRHIIVGAHSKLLALLIGDLLSQLILLHTDALYTPLPQQAVFP